MADGNDQPADPPFDNPLSELRAEIHKGLQMTYDRTAHMGVRMQEGFERLGKQLDIIARHLEVFDDDFIDLKNKQLEQSEGIDRIERALSHHLDRLDDHGGRIEKLEQRTADLPTPTK